MIYVLSGDNTHRKHTFVNAILGSYKGYSYYAFDCTEGDTFAQLDQLLTSVSLFGAEQKIVHIKEFFSLSPIEYIYDLCEAHKEDKDTILIFDSGQKIKSNAKILKYVGKKHIVDAASYTPEELSKLVTDKLEKAKVTNAKVVAKSLLELVDNDPFNLENEVDKLILLFDVHNDLPFHEVISKSIHATIWEYLRCIMQSHRLEAIRLANDLIEKGENEYSIIGMIIWNLKVASVVKAGENKTDASIAKDFGYNPYTLKNTRNQVKNMTLSKLSFLYERVIELDVKIKSGTIDPKLGMLLLSFSF